jgi:hypothetical protein
VLNTYAGDQPLLRLVPQKQLWLVVGSNAPYFRFMVVQRALTSCNSVKCGDMGEMGEGTGTAFSSYKNKAFVLFLLISSALLRRDIRFMYLRLSFILFFIALMV